LCDSLARERRSRPALPLFVEAVAQIREEDVGFLLLVVGAVGEPHFGESVSCVYRPCAVVALEDPQPKPARTATLRDFEQG
jgi:hypothetical protein